MQAICQLIYKPKWWTIAESNRVNNLARVVRRHDCIAREWWTREESNLSIAWGVKSLHAPTTGSSP